MFSNLTKLSDLRKSRGRLEGVVKDDATPTQLEKVEPTRSVLQRNRFDLEECLRLAIHNKIRDPYSEPFLIVEAIAELSSDFSNSDSPMAAYRLFRDYSAHHREGRQRLISDFHEHLTAEGVHVDDYVIDQWLVFCAERAFLVAPEYEIEWSPGTLADFEEIDKVARDWGSFFKRLIAGPYADGGLSLATVRVAGEGRASLRLQRRELVKELSEILPNPGGLTENSVVEQWLLFCAERAFLIDVPDEPDTSKQPLYQVGFTRIDDYIAEYFDEDFFADLILGRYGQRPMRESEM